MNPEVQALKFGEFWANSQSVIPRRFALYMKHMDTMERTKEIIVDRSFENPCQAKMI